MKTLRVLLTLLFLGVIYVAEAQNEFRGYPTQSGFEPQTESNSDFRMRLALDFEKRLGRHFELSLNEELRLEDNLKKVDRLNTQIALAYKVNPYLKIAANYVLMARYDKRFKTDDLGVDYVEKDWSLRHRFMFDLTGSVKLGQWRLSLKERVQATIRTDSVDVREKLDTEWEMKHRFQVQYSFRHKPWKPYAYVELRNTLNVQDIVGDNFLNRVRVSAGAEYLINSRSSFDFYYLFDYTKDYDIGFTKNKGLLKEFTTERGHYHTLGVQFNYKF